MSDMTQKFAERKKLLTIIAEYKECVKICEQYIAHESSARDGFFIGQHIMVNGKEKVVVGLEFCGYSPHYEIYAARVKNDGTPYNERHFVMPSTVKKIPQKAA